RPAGPGWRGAAIGRFRSGPSSISVVVSRYVFGSRPFQVSVDGERAAEAYAGEVIRVFVSEGAHEVAVYRHRLSKADCEIDLYEGEGLFICRDAERRYQVFPITGPGDRAKFEEGSRRSYMKGRRNLKLDCVGFAIVGAVAWAAVLFI
ncbi:MAG: hypothetical protein FWH47_06065, partial [Methanomassiliicoccaceae archaeon]|nr:hypothetical protein [Methanomassiliicoccaceae archaeon]